MRHFGFISLNMGRKEGTMHSTHFIYGYMTSEIWKEQHGKSVRSWCDGSLDRSFHGVDPLSYFSFSTGVTKAVVCVILSVGWCI